MRSGRNLGWIAAMLLPLCALAQGSSAGSMLPYSTNGVKVGDGRLHVTADVEARFDSAAGFFARESGGELTLQPELVWHFRPGLSFEVPGNAFDFRLAGNLDYLLYSGLVTRGSGSASRLQGGADLGITVNKNGVVELRLTDTFKRSDNTTNVGLGFATLSLGNFAKVEVPIRPGGGALEIAPGGGYGLEVFSPISSMAGAGCADASCDPGSVSQFDYQTAHGSLAVRWRFLPRTSVVLDNNFGYTFYPTGATPDTALLRSTLGIAGLLTQKLSINAKAGWAHNFGAIPASTIVGQAELTYPLTTTSMVRGGYLRDVQAVGLYGTAINDRAYANAKVLLGGKLALTVQGSFDWMSFGGATVRNDRVISAAVLPQYEVFPWLVASAGYQIGVRASDLVNVEAVNFTRHEGFVRATLRY